MKIELFNEINKEKINSCWKKIKGFLVKTFTIVKNDICCLNKKDFLLFSLFNFLCFIAPSTIYSLFYSSYGFRLDIVFLATFIPFAIFMAVARRELIYSCLFIFVVMELVEFSHIFYFGTPITPFEIGMIWKEKGEILESGLDTFPAVLIPFLSVLIPYITLLFLYYKKRKTKGSFITTVICIAMLSILPVKAFKGKKQRINNFMPRNDMVSLYNSLTSFSFLFNRNYYGSAVQDYKPYSVVKTAVENDINIVVIIGESANPTRMHLLGHSRPTTPNLDRLAVEDKNFVYGNALSSSVLTTVSTTMFANVMREPNNMKHLISQPTHLFKLAKQNGFKTFYISAQDNAIARGFAPDYIDVFHTKEYAPIEDAKKGDLVVLDKLDAFKTKFDNKNFIVLHQRNAHSPYDKGYRNIKEFKKWTSQITTPWEEQKRNSYDNAMLFNDYFIYKVIDFFKQNTDKQTYIFWIPDHSELLGEDGLWGHSIVNINVAKIPFVFTLLHKDNNNFISQLKNTFYPTHYEFGKMIANLLGYEITNPNEEKGIVYVNGNIITGDAGWFRIDKSDGKELKITQIEPK